jgi:hypothetical protein
MAPVPDSVLSADLLLDYMVKSLRTPQPDSTQTTLIKDPYTAIALFTHACMLAVGFRLVGLGEDHKIGMFSSPCFASQHTNISQTRNLKHKMSSPCPPSGMRPLLTPFATHTLNPRWNT